MCEYMYTTCTHVCVYMHILCIFKENEAFNFAVNEVGMGDMRGVGGRRHEQDQWEKWDGVM